MPEVKASSEHNSKSKNKRIKVISLQMHAMLQLPANSRCRRLQESCAGTVRNKKTERKQLCFRKTTR